MDTIPGCSLDTVHGHCLNTIPLHTIYGHYPWTLPGHRLWTLSGNYPSTLSVGTIPRHTIPRHTVCRHSPSNLSMDTIHKPCPWTLSIDTDTGCASCQCPGHCHSLTLDTVSNGVSVLGHFPRDAVLLYFPRVLSWNTIVSILLHDTDSEHCPVVYYIWTYVPRHFRMIMYI